MGDSVVNISGFYFSTTQLLLCYKVKAQLRSLFRFFVCFLFVTCQGWLPKQIFQAISTSQDPFLCQCCRSIKQEDTIKDLHNTICDLKGVINNLTEKWANHKWANHEPTPPIQCSFAEPVLSTPPIKEAMSLPTLTPNQP